MALAVAAVVLIGGEAGQNQQAGAGDEPANQNSQPTAEEAEQPPPTEPPPEEPQQEEPSQGEQASQDENQASEEPGGEEGLSSPALGDEGAPVVMVEYSDYQ